MYISYKILFKHMSCHFSSNALPSDRVVFMYVCCIYQSIKTHSNACIRTLQFDDDRPRPRLALSFSVSLSPCLAQNVCAHVKKYTLSHSIQPKCAYTFYADAMSLLITMHVCPVFFGTPMAFNMEISLEEQHNEKKLRTWKYTLHV